MKPYVEAELHDLIENIQAKTNIEDMTFEEAYLLLKEKIKEKQIPVELFWDPERLDLKSLWILDISELDNQSKLYMREVLKVDLGNYEIGWRNIDAR